MKACAICGRPLPARRRLYCSTECYELAHARQRQAARRKHRARSRRCVVCGAVYTPRRKSAKYCRPACRQEAHRRRWGPVVDRILAGSALAALDADWDRIFSARVSPTGVASGSPLAERPEVVLARRARRRMLERRRRGEKGG